MLSHVFFLSLYYVNALYIYITDMLHMSVKYNFLNIATD